MCAAQRTCDLAGLVLLKGSAKGHIHVHLYTGQEGGIDIFSSDSAMMVPKGMQTRSSSPCRVTKAVRWRLPSDANPW